MNRDTYSYISLQSSLTLSAYRDAVLQVRPHQHRAEGQDPLPCPAGCASFDAAQHTVGFLGCEGTLLAHVLLAVHQYPHVFFGSGWIPTF